MKTAFLANTPPNTSMAAPQDVTIQHLNGNWILVNHRVILNSKFWYTGLITRLSTEQGFVK
jgi:hypothetical protein